MPFSLAAASAALEDDAVQVVIRGSSYQNWAELDIDSDILNPADAFQVSGPLPSDISDFREGNKCDIYVGRDRQMAGVIDRVNMSGDRSRSTLRLSGRDLGGYLVDSEAKHIKAANYTIKTLIEALLEPSWGIKNVLVSNADNRLVMWGKKDKKKPRTGTEPTFLIRARKTTKIDPGERISSILDRHTRRLGLTWWLTANGDLFIGRPNYNQEAAYNFRCYAPGSKNARDNNVESWTVDRDGSDRFSELTVAGQGWGIAKNLWDTAKDKPKYSATVKDPDYVDRGIVRKLIISDSDILGQDEAQARADYEMGTRRLRGLSVNLTVPGFRFVDRLYAVDTIANVKIEEAGIDGNFYVTQRRFIENRNRRRTQLTLHEKNAWLP